MIQYLKCAWCESDVIFDAEATHPDCTVYWKANGHPANMMHVYCNASCALAWHEIVGKDNGI